MSDKNSNVPTTLVEGLTFPETPRWHDGRLWYLDLPAHSLRAVDLSGRDELIEKFDERPQSLEFLPDGSPVIAFAHTMQIIRLTDHSIYADLSELESQRTRMVKLNDMVVDGRGRLYIGCAAPHRDAEHTRRERQDAIAVVDGNGASRIVADGCVSPNGLAVTPDGGRLVAAETLLSRLVQWTIAEDGSLSSADTFAEVGDNVPDGICGDAEGAIWVAGVFTGQAIRVHDGGLVSDSVTVADGRFPIATMLGGPERRHLFILSCKTPNGQLKSWADTLQATGYVEVVEVAVPGGGWPAN